LRGTRGVLGPVMRTGRPVDSNHSVGRVRSRRGFTACSGREIGSEEGVMTTDMSATTQQLLREVESTDNLAPVGKEKRKQIDKLINELIETTANEDPLDNPDIFSNYNVAYTSPGDGQKGAPAGGRYRSRLGRLLFRTTGLYQMIDRPNLAKNLVTFALFGLFPGSIALVGKFEKVNPKTVRVFFEKPKLTLFGKTFNFGPTSSVVLWTPYLSGNLRIGKGSLGSLFVFTKGGKADDPKVIEEFDRYVMD